MTERIRISLLGLVAVGVAAPAAAQSLEVTVTAIRAETAEYHRPYVAIWLESAADPAIRTLAVWYDHDNREAAGTKWLSDLRSWWRKGGRDLGKPADAVTSATRAPGPQSAKFDVGALKPGDYTLHVEAVREEGGRELVSLPFSWNGATATAKNAGKAELGPVSLTLKP